MTRELVSVPDVPAPRTSAGRTATGLMLVLLLAAWPLFAVPGAPGAPDAAALILVGVAGWTAGGLVGLHRPLIVAGGLGVAVVAALLSGLPGSLTAAADALPLGYANANAALAVAAVLALVIVAGAGVDRRLQPAPTAAAVAITTMVITSGSRAGMVTCFLLLVTAPLLWRGRPLAWQGASVAILLIAGAVPVWLALAPASSRPPILVSALSDVRISLWEDALALAGDQPLVGIGAGEFARQSPIAVADADLAWAHSAPLQVLAEQGVVGLLLLASLVGWMVWVLGRHAVFLAILALQPMVDYVLAFPTVVAAYGLALGLAAVTPPRPEAGAHAPVARHRRSS